MLATVAIFGANHMVRTAANTAMPASARMKLPGVSVKASASVPMINSPIQPGEPRNIRIANSSWQRLTNFSPGKPEKAPVLQVAAAPAQIAADELGQARRVLLPALVLLRHHPHVKTAAPHQHRLDLVVAEDLLFARLRQRQLRVLRGTVSAAAARCVPNRVRSRPATRRCPACRSACRAACRTGRCG